MTIYELIFGMSIANDTFRDCLCTSEMIQYQPAAAWSESQWEAHG